MLNKRVPILFEESDYLRLAEVAREEKLSVGEVVRRAMRQKMALAGKRLVARRREALRQIGEWRKKFLAGNRGGLSAAEILQLVREGRKYEGGS